jgi:hypothetical protein
MSLAQRLADPWGLVAGGITGGLAGAVAAASAGFAVGLPIAVGTGAAVWAVKVGLDALTGRSATPRAVPPTGRALYWVQRADKAVGTLRRQSESVADPGLRERVADVDDRAAEVVTDLRRLAGQAAAVGRAAREVNEARLATEAARVRATVDATRDPALRAEQLRSLHALEEQLAVSGRLQSTEASLLARMESTTLGLEGLIAKLAEILALATMAGDSRDADRRLADLGDDLGGLRTGLVESEELSRQVLEPGAPGGAPASSDPADPEDRRGQPGLPPGAGAPGP